jgi:uncharacterized coiled-coil protein SlyX
MNESDGYNNLKNKAAPAGLGFFRGLVRLILVLLVGLFLGAVLYYLGSVYIYWQAVQPVQSSTSKLTVLETSIAAGQKASEDRLSQFNQRLTELEKQQTLDSEVLAELQSAMNALNDVVDGHTATLERLDELADGMDKLADQTEKNQEGLAGLQQTLISEDTPLANLGRELQILKAMELISRSRLYLIQNNPGLARQDVEAARQILSDIAENAPQEQSQMVSLWLQRLDLALGNLDGAAVIAANDLEIAWSMLAAGFSAPVQIETLPQAQTPTPEMTAKAATPPPATPTLLP